MLVHHKTVTIPHPEGHPEGQPPPVPNAGRPVWDQVITDMWDRDRVGRQRYGTPLQTHNGRQALSDAYEEVLDLAVYLKQELLERTALETQVEEGKIGIAELRDERAMILSKLAKAGEREEALKRRVRELESERVVVAQQLPTVDAYRRMAALQQQSLPFDSLTARDYFAAMAPASEIETHRWDKEKQTNTLTVQQARYRYADQMLAARKEPTPS